MLPPNLHGCRTVVPAVDTPPYLLRQFEANSGQIIQREVSALAEWCGRGRHVGLEERKSHSVNKLWLEYPGKNSGANSRELGNGLALILPKQDVRVHVINQSGQSNQIKDDGANQPNDIP